MTQGDTSTSQAAQDTESSEEGWTEQDAAPQQFSFEGPLAWRLLHLTGPAHILFRLFLTASLIDMIVLETNRYATEMLPRTKTMWKTDIGADEIVFFGIDHIDGECT